MTKFVGGLRRYVKFDTFHPAVEKGLPVTRVISRVTLQQILASACIRAAGEGVILNDCRVVDYEETVRLRTVACSSMANCRKICSSTIAHTQPSMSAAGADSLASHAGKCTGSETGGRHPGRW